MIKKSLFLVLIILNSLLGCTAKIESKRSNQSKTPGTDESSVLAKVENKNCIDPDLTKVLNDTSLMLCDGSIGSGYLDLSLLVPANIKKGISVAGVTGSDSGAPENCNASGMVGCVTTSSFKSIEISGLAAKIRRDINVAGEIGTYPSSDNLLEGADNTPDLTQSSFAGQIKQASAFEYFDSKGTRFVGNGDENIKTTNIVLGKKIFGEDGSITGSVSPNPWDLRYGVVVGSTTGKLKLNCRNMVDLAIYDNTTGLAAAGADVFDTIDDYGQGAGAFPSNNPWIKADEVFCGFSSPQEASWERVVTATPVSGANSVYLDRITNLRWTRGSSVGTKNWDDSASGVGTGAIEYCESLVHDGVSNWRLPTHKELLMASVHGIRDLDDSFHANSLGNLDLGYWSSTTNSFAITNAFFVIMGTGSPNSFANGKNQPYSVLCISPQ